MKRTFIAVLVCSALAGIVPASSRAAAPEPMACGDEIEKFCSHVTPGKLSLAVCLNENRESLSKECLAKVDKALVKIEEARKTCGADISKFCAEVKPGEGRVLNCLNAKKSELAPDCRTQVEKFIATLEAPVKNVPEKQPK